MSELSMEQEQEIVKALTDPELPWVADLFRSSHEIICGLLNCSIDEAREILEKIYVHNKAIEAVSESGGCSRPICPFALAGGG
jgi:hypothetical protein